MRIVLLLAYNVVRALTWPVRALWYRLRARRARWVLLTLRGGLEELGRPPPGLLRRLVPAMRPERRSVAEVRALVTRMLKDPHAEGLLVQLEHVAGGTPTLGSLRAELLRLRAGGKRVVVYLPEGGDQRTLYAASAADPVIAMPHASFSALGPAASRTYLKSLLDRIGVEAEVLAEGRYKSAAEPLVRDGMSAPERTQLEAIVKSLHDDWVRTVGARAKLGEAGAVQLFAEGVFGGERARALNAIDGCAYEDGLHPLLGLDARRPPVASARYRGGAAPRVFVPLRARMHIALVRLSGPIGERATRGGIALHPTTAMLRRLAAHPRVAGVLLHIDSPGGSALVSELLHRELAQLGAKKPTVAWLGDVAASGGYYLACAAPTIVAHPATLTGSIGVISLRPVAAALFARLGVRRELVSMTPFADLHALTRRSSEAEEALLRAESRRVYARFIEVVAAGRKRDASAIEALAEGRVWSGEDAAAQGLVDTLGGYHEALAALRARIDPGIALVDEPIAIVPPRLAGSVPFAAPPAAAGLPADVQALLGALARFSSGGERVLTYALDLPRLG
ncbi:MAG: signal peptide peptidase SppA [Polyangiales bacterium]